MEEEEEEMVVEFSLWCLNPAVVFTPLSFGAHSVILTSGTLSPLDTFASELGTEFKQTLEAPHVADVRKQVWAGVLPSGPDRVKLKADYATSSSLQFQVSIVMTSREVMR